MICGLQQMIVASLFTTKKNPTNSHINDERDTTYLDLLIILE
jgi:hypothetical protein